jgi:hypothetical protein
MIKTYEDLLLTRPPARLSKAERPEAKRLGYGAAAVVTRVGLTVRTFFFPTVKAAQNFQTKVEAGLGYENKHYVEVFKV